MTKYIRKLIVYAFAVTIAIACYFFMSIEYYKEFLFFLMITSSGFFAGNGLEHVSKAIKK